MEKIVANRFIFLILLTNAAIVVTLITNKMSKIPITSFCYVFSHDVIPTNSFSKHIYVIYNCRIHIHNST